MQCESFEKNLWFRTVTRRHLLVQSQQWKHQNDVNDVVLMSLLLTLNSLQTLIWRFHCWLWTWRYQPSSSSEMYMEKQISVAAWRKIRFYKEYINQVSKIIFKVNRIVRRTFVLLSLMKTLNTFSVLILLLYW